MTDTPLLSSDNSATEQNGSATWSDLILTDTYSTLKLYYWLVQRQRLADGSKKFLTKVTPEHYDEPKHWLLSGQGHKEFHLTVKLHKARRRFSRPECSFYSSFCNTKYFSTTVCIPEENGILCDPHYYKNCDWGRVNITELALMICHA